MIPFYFIFYFIALVVSIITFKKYFDTPLRFFPLLIAYTLFNELLGYFIITYEDFSFFDSPEYQWHNVIIYNIYNLFFYGYLLWVYYKLLKQRRQQDLIRIFAVILLLAYGVSLFFQDPFHSGLYFADCLASVLILVLIGLHFKQLYNSSGNQPRKRNHMVWFGLGMMLFNFYYPFYILNGYHNVEFFLKFQLRQILWVIIAIMYSLFTIGFLFGKRNYFK